MKIQFNKGSICYVKIRGQTRARRRVFKWSEMRFGSILCYVFSAPCRNDVRAVYDPTVKSLRISGERVPASEVSVPHYDLLMCDPEGAPIGSPTSNRKTSAVDAWTSTDSGEGTVGK